MSVIKLIPVLKNYIWGGSRLKKLYNRNSKENVAESWELSVHPDGESKIEGGAFNGKTLKEFIQYNKNCLGEAKELPILIKYIDAADNLSVQVHPDDEYSKIHENDNGKTEMWYIISAKKGSGIYCGLNKDLHKTDFASLISENKIESALNFIEVKAGNCFLIEAGTLHAIGKGVIICEIQQSSNVTYRVYDYNRLGIDGKPRQLHIEKALEVSKLIKYTDTTRTGKYIKFDGYKKRILTKCKYFACTEVITKNYFEYKNEKSFTALNIIKGSGKINNLTFSSGDTFFVPCGDKVKIEGRAKFILSGLNN
jgi:mannose-6-phosphate isomerase